MKFDKKSLRIIEFTGKNSDWRVWSRKFLTWANQKGYKSVLVGKEQIPTESENDDAVALDPHTTESKLVINVYKNNELAYEDQFLSISGDTKTGKMLSTWLIIA